MERPSGMPLLAPLATLCVVVGLVAIGPAQGFWLDNLHNGLLAIVFSLVGATTLLGRPGHREGVLLLLTGLAQSILFVGRQVDHFSTDASPWWTWVGVWPLALVLGLVSWCVLCFPEGRFLSRGWAAVGLVIAVACLLLSAVSALWPVEYADAGVTGTAPFDLAGHETAHRLWSPVAHPAYAALQVVWVVAVVARWRRSDPVARRQLLVVALAVGASLIAVVVSLLATGTAQPGLLVTPVIPLACGYALERLSLGKVIDREARAGHLTGLSPREQEVLDLMSQGLSNNAISARLHLSIKTVEPIVGSIFRKMAMPDDSSTNRRVLAVVRYLGSREGPS